MICSDWQAVLFFSFFFCVAISFLYLCKMDLKLQKKELRKKIREQKKVFPSEEKLSQSREIFSFIEESPLFKEANIVLLYWSMDDEVSTHDFILKWYETKTILLPCVVGDDLVLRRFEGLDSMLAGEQFGIAEPVGAIFEDYAKIDLMIIPGVAFDSCFHRMGRGRGFYDRLLSLAKTKKMGICFDFQLVDKVPVEDFDVAMDCIVSKNGFVKHE